MNRFHPCRPERRGTLRWLLATCCCLALFIAPAFAKSWRVSDYQDTIVVTKDGSAVVHEHITLVFIGEWHGIHRTIPVDYPGPGGTNYTLFFDINGVTDGNGHKLKYETSTSKGFRDLKIFIPNAVDTSSVVDIEYVVRNGTRFFPDHDEFYWNVTGNDWPVPIDHASARVSFPVAAAGSLRAQAYTGVYGAAERDATTDIRNSDILFETTNPLPMRGGLTVDIYLPKGILDEPSSLTKIAWFVGSNPIVFLPLFTLGVMFTIWWYKGRDPDPGRSVAPMYEPPTGFTPAEAGTLVDDEVHPRDITSTLVDLAVRGYLKIEETVDTTMLVFHHKDYTFHLLKSRDQWDKLAPHESVMMMNVFGLDTDVKLSSLKNRFYKALPLMKQDIKGALKTKGMYRLDPDSANSYNLGGGLLIIAPFVLMQYLGIRDVFNSVGLLFGIGVLSVFIFWLFARQMSARTMEGARTRVAILGFQEFMNRVDAHRLQRMPPDTFEKYLPYAMALGVEHNWAKAFAGIIQSPPSWYVSPNGYSGFNPLYFSNSMHSMSSDMQQTFASAPRNSSSGSGFGGSGGGGFSGGGFGGGGGSAF
jgi:hypothetical protein